MSPHWAITGAEIGAAPTWGEESDDGGKVEGEGMGGLMLKVEGVEAALGGAGDGMGEKDVTVEELEGLAEGFQRGMEGLRRVVEQGERWEGVKAVGDEDDGGDDA